MKIKLVIISLIAILLVSCKTLPEPGDNLGILAIKVHAVNKTDTKFLVQYQINLRDNDQIIRVKPQNIFIFVLMEKGDYETESIESIPYLYVKDISKPDKKEISFSILPNQITIFPYKFFIEQQDIPNKKGWVSQNKQLRFIDDISMNELISELETYKNYDSWLIK